MAHNTHLAAPELNILHLVERTGSSKRYWTHCRVVGSGGPRNKQRRLTYDMSQVLLYSNKIVR
jgi:hypothetical protein